MAIAFCPDCEEPIQLGALLRVGQRVTCESCTAELEVIEVSPLELDWAFDGPADEWDDEEEDDEWDDAEADDDWDDEDWDDDDDDG